MQITSKLVCICPNYFIGAQNTYPQGETEEDSEHGYENVETIFHQKDDSDDSDNDYVNVGVHEQICEVDSDYEDEEMYENWIG